MPSWEGAIEVSIGKQAVRWTDGDPRVVEWAARRLEQVWLVPDLAVRWGGTA